MTDTPDRGSNLSEALRAVAREDADRGASLDVQARLLKEVRAIARAGRRRRMRLTAVAVAASLVLVAGIVWWQERCYPSPIPPAPAPTIAGAELTTGFMPLMYAGVPMIGGHLVRMRVPERALLAYGLAAPTAFGGGVARTVVADVLVGNDGLARAVRFVRPAVSKEQ